MKQMERTMDEEQARELRSRLAAMAASFDCAVTVAGGIVVTYAIRW